MSADTGLATMSGALPTGPNVFEDAVESLRESLTCQICLKLLYEPFTTSCGHTYCYECLNQWFAGNGDGLKKSCPDCRARIKQQPAPAYLVRQMVEVLCKQDELLPDNETVDEHTRMREEMVSLVDKHRKDTGPRGGLFEGRFNVADRPNAFRDEHDGIWRCPGCHGELDDHYCPECDFAFDEDGAPIPTESFYDDVTSDLDYAEGGGNEYGPDLRDLLVYGEVAVAERDAALPGHHYLEQLGRRVGNSSMFSRPWANQTHLGHQRNRPYQATGHSIDLGSDSDSDSEDDSLATNSMDDDEDDDEDESDDDDVSDLIDDTVDDATDHATDNEVTSNGHRLGSAPPAELEHEQSFYDESTPESSIISSQTVRASRRRALDDNEAAFSSMEERDDDEGDDTIIGYGDLSFGRHVDDEEEEPTEDDGFGGYNQAGMGPDDSSDDWSDSSEEEVAPPTRKRSRPVVEEDSSDDDSDDSVRPRQRQRFSNTPIVYAEDSEIDRKTEVTSSLAENSSPVTRPSRTSTAFARPTGRSSDTRASRAPMRSAVAIESSDESSDWESDDEPPIPASRSRRQQASTRPSNRMNVVVPSFPQISRGERETSSTGRSIQRVASRA